MGEANVLRAVGALYEAAAEGGSWRPALRALSALFDAQASVLLLVDGPAGIGGLVEIEGAFDGTATERYNGHYAAVDPFVPLVAAQRPGRVLVSDRVFTPCEIGRFEIYADYLRPLGLGRSMAAPLFAEADRSALLGIHRSADRPPFSDRDIALCTALVPHLRRALQILRQMSRASLGCQSLAAALDSVAFGIVVLDRDGRVIRANAEAETIFARGDGLGLDGQGRVRARDRRAADALDRLIAETLRRDAQPPSMPSSGCTLAIARGEGRRPYSLLLAPLLHDDGLASPLVDGGRPRLLMILRDPDREIPQLPDVLARHFGLTRSEGRLAAALVAGRSPRDYAVAAGISMNTVRAHLKRIYAKTGTDGQVGLVRVALHDLAAFDLRGPSARP